MSAHDGTDLVEQRAAGLGSRLHPEVGEIGVRLQIGDAAPVPVPIAGAGSDDGRATTTGTSPIEVWFASFEDAAAEARADIAIDALLRAGRVEVHGGDGEHGAQAFFLALRSPDPARPYVGEHLRVVHGLSNDDAVATIARNVGIDQVLLSALRSEGQSFDLLGLAGRIGAGRTMAWEVEAPTRVRCRYTVTGSPGQPEVSDREADITFTYTHLTYLLRLLTGEHDLFGTIARGRLRIDGAPEHLEALATTVHVPGS